jgi:glycosyltransferase involved in cell wall biosynthesis
MISVIIPVFNRLQLLQEAVNSVLEQDYEYFELIVADDGSDPEFSPRQKGILPDDPRIRILNFPHSGMPGLVRNRGASAARGEYLAFLDSDDLWLRGKLSAQLNLFRANPEADLVHTREIWQRGRKIVSQKGMHHKHSGFIFPDALEKCIIGPSTVMICREKYLALGGFREDLEIAEDYEFWLRWTAILPVLYINEPQVVKRAGGWEQLSEKYGQIEKFRIAGLADLVEQQWFHRNARCGTQRQAEKELVRKCRIYANGAGKRGKHEEAAAYVRIAEKYEMLFQKT